MNLDNHIEGDNNPDNPSNQGQTPLTTITIDEWFYDELTNASAKLRELKIMLKKYYSIMDFPMAKTVEETCEISKISEEIKKLLKL